MPSVLILHVLYLGIAQTVNHKKSGWRPGNEAGWFNHAALIVLLVLWVVLSCREIILYFNISRIVQHCAISDYV